MLSNNGYSANIKSQKFDGHSDSKDDTYNSCKAKLGKPMKQAVQDTGSQHVMKQLRSNSLQPQNDEIKKVKNCNVLSTQKSNKKSNVQSSVKKSNSSRLKVSIDFGKNKDSVKVEEKEEEFLAPTQVKKVTRRMTNNSQRE